MINSFNWENIFEENFFTETQFEKNLFLAVYTVCPDIVHVCVNINRLISSSIGNTKMAAQILILGTLFNDYIVFILILWLAHALTIEILLVWYESYDPLNDDKINYNGSFSYIYMHMQLKQLGAIQRIISLYSLNELI